MLTESFGRAATGNHSGRDKQVPAVKDCRFTQTAFGTVVHDSSGKWLGQYETEDAAVYMYTGFAPNAQFPWIFQFMMKFGGASFKGGCCVELDSDMLTVKSSTFQLIPGEKEAIGTSFVMLLVIRQQVILSMVAP